ncbi:MAG: hypothetical protein H6600_10335 [Flavobacteriales bacterium]|nr:hypothetical protein [Flavobacteriales bacterium]
MQVIRELYNIAHLRSDYCDRLIEITTERDEAVVLGYHAAAMMISAKFVVNPFTKVKSFNIGKQKLETLIQTNKNEYELIYLRYSIQKNTPSFLGYNKNIKTDRIILMNFLNQSQDQLLKDHIVHYLKNTQDY